MAVDMFIKIDGIKGESADDKHKEEIDVLSWSWGMSQSGSAHMGGGAGAGKVNVNDLSFTKYIDVASPDLYRDGEKVKETTSAFEATKAKLKELYAHWEEAVELN